MKVEKSTVIAEAYALRGKTFWKCCYVTHGSHFTEKDGKIMERRHFIKHLAAVSATSLFSAQLPRICAYAQEASSRPHFFMFVFARGGWDTTTVFEPKVGLDTIDVDPEIWSGRLLVVFNF